MNNLKIYIKAKEKTLKKVCKIAVFSLATAIMLTGCGESRKEENRRYLEQLRTKNEQAQMIDTNTIEEITIEQNDKNPSKTIIEGIKEETKLNYNENSYVEFNNYLNQINTYYQYEEYYNFEKNLNNIQQLNKSQKNRKTDLTIQNLSTSKLKQIVLENNKEYIQKQTTTFYKEIDSKTLDKTLDIIVETTKGMEDKIEIEKVLSTLEDLKIFKDATPANAFLTNENCLIVNTQMIEVLQKMHPEIDAFKNTLTHESMHILQKNSSTIDDNLELNIGPSYKFKNNDINSLSFTWLIESSAEKLTMGYLNTKNVIYDNMINYHESINLSNSLNQNFNKDELTNLSLKNDLNGLLKQFNSNNYETLKMLYALEIMQQSDYSVYEKVTGNEINSDSSDKLNYSLKASVCETMTKNFYRGLSEVSAYATLEDVFYLITVFENDLNVHLKYFKSDRLEYNKEFMNKYVEIQNNYFKLLANYTNKSQQEIEENFNNYGIKGENYNNYTLNFLSKDTKKYIEDTKNRIDYINDYSIRTYNQKFQNQQLKH